MLGDIEMHDSSAMMSEHYENEQYAEPGGGNREEIEGDEISDMVGKERSATTGMAVCAASASAGKPCAQRGRGRA